MSKVPICRARTMISSLSSPMQGRNTGIETAASVTPSAGIVCEATCPTLSPVTSAPAPMVCAVRSASRIIKRRSRRVKSFSSHFCISVS